MQTAREPEIHNIRIETNRETKKQRTKEPNKEQNNGTERDEHDIDLDVFHFNTKDLLHQGKFTQILRGFDRTDQKKRPVVGKFVSVRDISQEQKNLRLEEIDIHREVSGHPNIIKLLAVFESANEFVLVLEYSDLTLLQFLTQSDPSFPTLDDLSIRRYFLQICSAVELLHSRYIVHGDLKLDNVIYDKDSDSMKIIDFGHASIVQNGKLRNIPLGTPGYVAPEICLQRNPPDPFKIDTYSLGVILYQLIFRKFPFDDKDGLNYYVALQSFIYNSKKRTDLRFPGQGKISKKLSHLLQSALAFDPAERISLAAMMRDPWLVVKTPVLQQIRGFVRSVVNVFHVHDNHLEV